MPEMINNEKIDVLNRALLRRDIDLICSFDFLTSKMTPAQLTEIIELFYTVCDEKITNDECGNNYYFACLENLIDVLINYDYQLSKSKFLFGGVNILHDYIIGFFNQNKNLIIGHEIILQKLTYIIYSFVNEGSTKEYLAQEYIHEMIIELYSQYKEKGHLSKEQTSPFYNKILNTHANQFKNRKRRSFISDLKNTLPLHPERRKLIENKYLLHFVSSYVQKTEFYNNPEQKRYTEQLLLKLRDYINRLTVFRRQKIVISESEFIELEQLFFHQRMDFNSVATVLSRLEQPVVKLVLDRYNQLKLRLFKYFLLPIPPIIIPQEERETFVWNDKNFSVNDIERTCLNFSKVLLLFSGGELLKVIADIERYKDLLLLLPLVGLHNFFDFEEYFYIFNHYDQVMKYINQRDNTFFDDNVKKIISNLDVAIPLSNSLIFPYDKLKCILGEDVLSKIEPLYYKDYFQFYLQMLSKKESYIPTIKGDMDDQITYETNLFSDSKRLLIGKIEDKESCIDLLEIGSGGADSYYMCLTDEMADVILLKDKKADKLIGRILVFRKGNALILAPLYGTDEIINKCDRDFLKTIAHELLISACIKGDNLEYVMMSAARSVPGFPRFRSEAFHKDLPHADVINEAYLLASKDGTETLTNIDFSIHPQEIYGSEIGSIKYDGDVHYQDLQRLFSLYSYLEKDHQQKEDIESYIDLFWKQSYTSLVATDEWLLAIATDGEVIEILLPTISPESRMQLLQEKQRLGIETEKRYN